MLNRIFQVLHALTAKMCEQDLRYVNSYLNKTEQNLFYAMDVNSQKHSVNVAKTCHQLAATHPNIDTKLLTRAALLHDIGKIQGDLTTFRRISIVLINYLCPKLGKLLAQKGSVSSQQNIYYAFYIYKVHPNLGYQKALQAGVELPIRELIAKHHLAYVPDEPLELTLLRQADNLN